MCNATRPKEEIEREGREWLRLFLKELKAIQLAMRREVEKAELENRNKA